MTQHTEYDRVMERIHQHELACSEAYGSLQGSVQTLTALLESHITDFRELSRKVNGHLGNPHFGGNGSRRQAIIYTGGGGLLGGGLVVGILEGIMRLV